MKRGKRKFRIKGPGHDETFDGCSDKRAFEVEAGTREEACHKLGMPNVADCEVREERR